MAREHGNWQGCPAVRGAMRRFVISLGMIGIVVTGCAASSSAPLAVASPEVVCDRSQFQPPPDLTCGPAITAALAVLAPAHPPDVPFVELHDRQSTAQLPMSSGAPPAASGTT